MLRERCLFAIYKVRPKQYMQRTAKESRKNRRNAVFSYVFLKMLFFCLLFRLFGFFGYFFLWGFHRLPGFLSGLCLLGCLHGFFERIYNYTTAIRAAIGTHAMHKMLNAAFWASNKTRYFKSVVGTAIGRVSLGVSHVYYHSAPKYTQTDKKRKYQNPFRAPRGLLY